MVLITVLKLDFSCPKCKKKLLQSISKLQGINKIELDEDKSTVTVTGNADPCAVITRARKTGKHVQVLTIGPPPPPPEPPAKENYSGGQKKQPEEDVNKKPDEKISTPVHHIHTLYPFPQPHLHLHPHPHPHPHPHLPYHGCEQMYYPFVEQYPNEPNAPCSIL